MKITDANIKKLISLLGFVPEDGRDNVYIKKYVSNNNYIIRINFNTRKIEYRAENVAEQDGIILGDATTSNFENSENFVVLECVNRLLEKGYAPCTITLEKRYPLGRNLKGKVDIVVSDRENKPFLMVECKTWGQEFDKEKKKMLKDGAQLFSYYANDRAVQYLCLYASRLSGDEIEYKNSIVPVGEEWIELANVKEIFDHWNKNFKDNGIFESWATAYGIEIKALVRGQLQPLTKDDSGRIFNQFAEILRHNVVSDKPNAFNKILNLFICKIIDEDKNEDEQVGFQWLEDDTDESLQVRLNDLYKKGMHRFLEIDVTDFSDEEITGQLANINDKAALEAIKNMLMKLRLQKNPEFAFIEVYNDQSFKTNARIVREVVELLQPYQFRYGHKQQFLGDFFELLLNTSIKQEAGQYFTPVPICRYIVYSLPVKEFIESRLKKGDPNTILPAVIDFACGTGHFLTEFMDRVQSVIEDIDISAASPSVRKKLQAWRDYGKYDWAAEYVYGIDADYRLVKSSKVNSFLNGDGEANIIRANGLDHFSLSKEYKGRLKEVAKDNPQDNGQFDMLIANPPYAVSAFKSTVKHGDKSFELFEKLTDNSSEIECLFVERMKQLLKVGGYAGIILPSTILSNLGIYTAAREIILKYFKIKGITELGPNTFMATDVKTVILFLERRANNEHKQIASAVNNFFERPKDTTVLGIEKAFSKYIAEVFDGISFDDYASFVSRKANNAFQQQEIWTDYQSWFASLAEIVKLKKQKQFLELAKEEQQKELENRFYDKVLAMEREKIIYFFLTCTQNTVIVKSGEKQAEKEFLGYEFSKRRGHEGIKLLPMGTKLFDEYNLKNSQKANSYNYRMFLDENIDIDEEMKETVSVVNTSNLLSFNEVQFDKVIRTVTKRTRIDSQYSLVKISDCVSVASGLWTGAKAPLTVAPVIRNTNFTLTGKLDLSDVARIEVEEQQLQTRRLQREDIVLEKSGGSDSQAVGRVVLFDLDDDYYSFSNFTARLRVNNEAMLPQYLYQILNYIYQKGWTFAYQSGASGLKNLSMDSYLSFRVPCPPLETQQIIINQIETIEKAEKDALEKIRILKREIANPAFFDYPSERLGKISLMIQRGKSAVYGKSNIQIIKSGQARGYTEFDFKNRYYVSETFTSDERNLQRGDILINSTGVGTAGRVTLFDLDGDYVVDSHITVVRLDKTQVHPKYVLYALANIGFKTIEQMANGQSGQIELAASTIANLRIPLPQLDVQHEIVSKLEPIEKEISMLNCQVDSITQKKIEILEAHF